MTMDFPCEVTDRECWTCMEEKPNYCGMLAVCSHSLGMFRSLTSIFSCSAH